MRIRMKAPIKGLLLLLFMLGFGATCFDPIARWTLSFLAQSQMGGHLLYTTLAIKSGSLELHQVQITKQGQYALHAHALRLFRHQGQWYCEADDPHITLWSPCSLDPSANPIHLITKQGHLHWHVPELTPLSCTFTTDALEGHVTSLHAHVHQYPLHDLSRLLQHIDIPVSFPSEGQLSGALHLHRSMDQTALWTISFHLSDAEGDGYIQGECRHHGDAYEWQMRLENIPIAGCSPGMPGTVSGRASCHANGTYTHTTSCHLWNLSSCEISALQWKYAQHSFTCQKLKGHANSLGDSELLFQGASFTTDAFHAWEGRDWQGHCAIEKGYFLFSSLQGCIEGIPMNFQLHGPVTCGVATGRVEEEGSLFVHWDLDRKQLHMSGTDLRIPVHAAHMQIGSLYCTATQEPTSWNYAFEIDRSTLLLTKTLYIDQLHGSMQCNSLGHIDLCEATGTFHAFHTTSPFILSQLTKTGSTTTFDLRLQIPLHHLLFDGIRLVGSYDATSLCLDPRQSHLLGSPLYVTGDLHQLTLQGSFPLPLHLMSSDGPHECEPHELDSIQFHALCTCHDDTWSLAPLSLKAGPYHLSCEIHEQEIAHGTVTLEGESPASCTFQGHLNWQELDAQLQLLHFQGDMPARFPLRGDYFGHGSCHLSPDGVEASFTIDSQALALHCHIPHLTYTPAKNGQPAAWISPNTEIVADNAPSWLPPLQGEMSWIPSLSTWTYTAEHITPWLPQFQASLHDQTLQLSCHFLGHETALHIALQSSLIAPYPGQLHISDAQDRLTCDFTYPGTLQLSSIRGACAGIEALFVPKTPSLLIGSAAIQCDRLKPFLPYAFQRIIDALELNRGYTLRGQITLDSPSFTGTLDGKEIDLFGYQFHTLTSHIEIQPEQIHISHLKISDRACTLTLPQLSLLREKKEEASWTIHMPSLTIAELRPSLLTISGQPESTLSPLVVRTLTLEQFQGNLQDRLSYTAHGELHFINSFKRDRSLFDLPSALLGRLFGFDFELLIPVEGTVQYQLHHGAFHLTNLLNTYSEGHRSHFSFLPHHTGPFMDLDGNLHIVLQTKQYVLFTLTEHVCIAIGGTLKSPTFHLQKK